MCVHVHVCVVDRWIGFSKEHTYTHAPIQYFPEIHMKNKETQFGAKKRRNCKYTCQTWRYEPVLKHTITHTCENRESGKLEKRKINNKKKNTDGNDACEIGKIGAMGIFSVLEGWGCPQQGKDRTTTSQGRKEGRVHYNLQCLFHEKWNDTIKFLI